jgi:formate C-acetyltransferase
VLPTAQLKHALDTNFEDETTTPTGPEIQRLCKRVPKYGNDVAEVDLIARNCLDIAVKELRQYKTDYGAIYGTTVSPVTAHVSYGMICGATPDGRKAGTPLSDSVSPTQGADLQGPTASVKSVSNLAHMNLVQGTIYNLKMHPAAMGTRAGLMKWANLVRTYFDLGGWEVQFNVVDTEVLKDALEHPENHRNLVVRVVGYSAFFVELDRATQEDIIARTEHAF